MTFRFLYGENVAVLPQSVLPMLGRAKNDDIKVLLYLAEHIYMPLEEAKSAICEKYRVPSKVFDDALNFWRGAGILTVSDYAEIPDNSQPSPSDNKETAETQKRQKKLLTEDRIPSYTAEEIKSILEKKPETKILIDQSQQLLGRIFTHSEASSLIGLYAHLGLSAEYILTLCAFCKKQNKDNVHYIEKTAFALYNDNICTAAELNIYLKNREKKQSVEYKIRKLFGMGERAMTKKENEYIERWIIVWEMPFDVVEYAYEKMINNIQKPKMSYMNKILEKWHTASCKTLEDVKKLEENRRFSENVSDTNKPSFDIDEFFADAVKRGYDRAKNK